MARSKGSNLDLQAHVRVDPDIFVPSESVAGSGESLIGAGGTEYLRIGVNNAADPKLGPGSW